MRYPMLLCTLLVATLLAGHDARAATALTSYGGVAISPDGRYVVDVESVELPDESREPASHVFVRNVENGDAREISLSCAGQDECSASLPTWSHDSRSVAFVVHAKREAKTRDLLVATIGAGEIVSKKLLTFVGTLGSVRYSRDDTKLAMLAIPNARKEVGATQAGAAIVGEIGTDFDEQRIAVVRLSSPAIAYVSPPDLFVYEYDWMPDGTGFVGTAAHGDGDNNWWVARLYRFDAVTTAATEIYRPSSAQQQIASPRVSLDGSQVVFIGGIMSDFGSTGGDAYALSLTRANAAAVDITPAVAGSVTSIAWMCKNQGSLAVTVLRDDKTEIDSAAASGPGPLQVFNSDSETLSSGDGANVSESCEHRPVDTSIQRMAAIRQAYDRAPEIEVIESNALWKPLTHANDGIPAEAIARSITWKNDGFNVQGWLLEPKTPPVNGTRALITSVHGGPAAANVPRFIGRGATRDLLRHGYAVFLPNPRGSFGQGEAFTLANVKDFGYGDLRDILTGIDAAEKADPAIDNARLGITGGSYGGYMTMWAVTQTNRFKAAVAGAGISDLMSYYGENGIDEWMIPYFGASAYDDPAVYRKSSPIEFIKNVKTPTFEYVGERDVECPAPQSQEFWHALASRGVPTSLVIYAGEGHGIRAPKNRIDVMKRTLAWFDRYLKP